MQRRPNAGPRQPAAGQRSGVCSSSRVLTLAVLFLLGSIGGVTWTFLKGRLGGPLVPPATNQVAHGGRVKAADHGIGVNLDNPPTAAAMMVHVGDIGAPDKHAQRVTPAPPVLFDGAKKVEYPSASADRFGGITCPPYDARIDALQIPLKHLPRKKATTVAQKYDRRANNCASNGIWNKIRIEDHHKILHHMVRLGKVQRNSFVLDWGSGCGHSLQFLVDEYNAHGLGIDVSNKTIEYARTNTSKRNMHCVADGTRLQFLPTDTFDHVISFGSIYHVYNRTLFCHVLRQLLRVVKVGGTVYNGWTENGEYHRKHYGLCFKDLPASVALYEEKVEFKDVELFPLKAHQDTPNTYSAVITKTGPLTSDSIDAINDLEAIPIECGVHQCDVRGSGVALRDTPKPTKKSAQGEFAAQGLASEQTDAPPPPSTRAPRPTKPPTTEAPPTTTEAPVETTDAPTDAPTVAPTEAPTDAPVEKTDAPAETTEAPAQSNDQAETTKAAAKAKTAHKTKKAKKTSAPDPAAGDASAAFADPTHDDATTKASAMSVGKQKKNKKPKKPTAEAAEAVEATAESTEGPKKKRKPKKKPSAAPDVGEATANADTPPTDATESPAPPPSTTAVEVPPPTPEPGPWGNLQCPPYDRGIEALQIPLKHLPRKKPTTVAEKYDRRSNNCRNNGIWHKVTLQDHKAILEVIARLLKLKRTVATDGDAAVEVQGDATNGPVSVFDWGCGCGHKLNFLASEFGTRGFGIDVSNKTIDYARRETTTKNMYCVADGTRLEWIPSDTFDRALSFGSVYHVYDTVKFCHVLREMVRIVKPGGIVYNGWSENSEYKRSKLDECLRTGAWMEGAERNTVQVLEEAELFKSVAVFPLKTDQQQINSYSVVIVKAPAND